MSILLSKFFLKKIEAILLCFLLWFCAIGCGPDKETIIREKVAQRVGAFRAKKVVECRETLLREAEKIVDSLLLEGAIAEMNDSLARLRPFRPIRPNPLPPIDSLPVKPLFKQ